MASHILKIKETFLIAKLDGDKLFEIRLNDRGYQKGDTVTYIQPKGTDDLKPLKHNFEITYVTNYEQKDNYVVFGEKFINTENQI